MYNGAYRRPTGSYNVTRVEEKITETRYNCAVWLKGGYKSKWEPICIAGHLPNRDSKGISVILFGIKLDEDGKLKVSPKQVKRVIKEIR